MIPFHRKLVQHFKQELQLRMAAHQQVLLTLQTHHRLEEASSEYECTRLMTHLFIAPERIQDYSLFVIVGVGVFFNHCAIILGKRRTGGRIVYFRFVVSKDYHPSIQLDV
jgi:hypothetical protein